MNIIVFNSDYEPYIASINLSQDDFGKAYDEGVRRLGYDLDFTQSEISLEFANALFNEGYEIEDLDKHKDSYPLYPEEACRIFMFIASLGNKKLQYEFVNPGIISAIQYGEIGQISYCPMQ